MWCFLVVLENELHYCRAMHLLCLDNFMVIHITQTLQRENVENTEPYLTGKKRTCVFPAAQPEILLFGSLWDFGKTRRESNWTHLHKPSVLLRQTLQRISALKCKQCSHWGRQGQWQTDAEVFVWIWAFKASTHPWACAEHSLLQHCACPPSQHFFVRFLQSARTELYFSSAVKE